MLAWLKTHFSAQEVRIVSPQDIVLKASSSDGQHTVETAIYKTSLFDAPEIAELDTATDDEWIIEEHLGSIDDDFPYPQKTLAQIGVPFLDILTVEANGDFHFVELTGDEQKLIFE